MAANPKNTLIRAAITALSSLAVRWGVKLPELSKLIKESLLLAAREDLLRRGEKETTSKLAVMTGIHRKFIPGLLTTSAADAPPSLIERVVETWQRNRDFSSARAPRTLGIVGPESEFAKLVSSVNGDLNPYTVLFEMERLGLVTRNEQTVALTKEFFDTRADISSSAILTERNIVDLAAAVQQNIGTAIPTPHLHLTTEYDAIPDEAIADLQRWILEEGSAFHARLRAKLSAHDSELNPLLRGKPGRNRISVTAFSFIEPTPRK